MPVGFPLRVGKLRKWWCAIGSGALTRRGFQSARRVEKGAHPVDCGVLALFAAGHHVGDFRVGVLLQNAAHLVEMVGVCHDADLVNGLYLLEGGDAMFEHSAPAHRCELFGAGAAEATAGSAGEDEGNGVGHGGEEAKVGNLFACGANKTAGVGFRPLRGGRKWERVGSRGRFIRRCGDKSCRWRRHARRCSCRPRLLRRQRARGERDSRRAGLGSRRPR